MRLSLRTRSAGGRDPQAFAMLPGLCCQAAGGEAAWATPVSAAWQLLYTAAHLMDSLEDQDEPDEWWAERGPGAALNAATGLFFSASLALQELHQLPLAQRAAQETISLALQPFLRMSSGQYADFTSPPQTLDEYWRIAAAKSGEFFALACEAGARLASNRPETLDGFRQFGMNVGLLVQMADDLADYRDLIRGLGPADTKSLGASLPGVYLRTVSAVQVSERFESLLHVCGDDARQELVHILDENGAGVYLSAEMEMRRSLAAKGLEAAAASGTAHDALLRLLQRV